MTGNTFGFGAAKKSARVPQDMDDINKKLEAAAQLAPQPVDDDPAVERALRKAAEERNDTIRQTPLEVAKKFQAKGPSKQLSARLSIRDYNRMVRLSQHLRLPYDRTIEVLLDAAGVGDDGVPTKPLHVD